MDFFVAELLGEHCSNFDGKMNIKQREQLAEPDPVSW